jgi:hypothetical protein
VFKKANEVLVILCVAVVVETGAFIVAAVTQKVDESISNQRKALTFSKAEGKRQASVLRAEKNRNVSERKFRSSISLPRPNALPEAAK